MYFFLTSDEQLHRVVLGECPVEPGEDGVGVDVVVQPGHEVAEDEALLARAVGGHPQPAVAQVVVDEEDIALLETEGEFFITIIQECSQDRMIFVQSSSNSL